MRGNFVFECENVEIDDEDAFINVIDGVSYWSNFVECLVGDLVVYVVVEINRGECYEEFCFIFDGDGFVDVRRERRVFKVDGER